jgi:hypothetical protein
MLVLAANRTVTQARTTILLAQATMGCTCGNDLFGRVLRRHAQLDYQQGTFTVCQKSQPTQRCLGHYIKRMHNDLTFLSVENSFH